MPVIIANDLPSKKWLEKEHIFYMQKKEANRQDIRPLKTAVVNLMPTKEETERQFLRLLSISPLQNEVCFLHMNSHKSKNTDMSHMKKFYRTPKEIMKEKFDLMIITGAPVETMPFEDVDYWAELAQLMEYTKKNVFCTLHICWGAQAGLYYHYGVEKALLNKKCFGVYPNKIMDSKSPLFWGFDEEILVPHSRHTETDTADIKKVKALKIEALSDKAGASIMSAKEGRQIFITGHLEYDVDTLDKEYRRDVAKGVPIKKPENYYKNDTPLSTWRAGASLFYNNLINMVYQRTPYDLNELEK
ncbi:homoserine O-succinyltransferase [Elusimicrobium posterum]|uniref:homoserine O-succinyltransferase n=1 Tax=Elusimicrobium posterum TaxID=3116653 RepID=UPI003C71F251